jgi:hypothetical protein
MVRRAEHHAGQAINRAKRAVTRSPQRAPSYCIAFALDRAFVGGVCVRRHRCLGGWVVVSLYLACELYLGCFFIRDIFCTSESWRTLVASRLVHRSRSSWEMLACWEMLDVTISFKLGVARSVAVIGCSCGPGNVRIFQKKRRPRYQVRN